MFVDLASHLHASGDLERLGVTPLLVAATRTPFAEALRARFREEVPTGMLVDTFLTAAELADVFASTRLNVHPCRYDAYGMTVIEAASQGAPSLIHSVRCHLCCVALPALPDCQLHRCFNCWHAYAGRRCWCYLYTIRRAGASCDGRLRSRHRRGGRPCSRAAKHSVAAAQHCRKCSACCARMGRAQQWCSLARDCGRLPSCCLKTPHVLSLLRRSSPPPPLVACKSAQARPSLQMVTAASTERFVGARGHARQLGTTL